MSPFDLDPDNPLAEGSWKPNRPLSASVRAFGHYPDLSLWRPGDLVLYSAKSPNPVSRRIIAAQEDGGHLKENARWHHVAIYVGEGYVCDAVPLYGVRYRLVDEDFLTKTIRVRRDASLGDDERYRIAIHGLTKLRTSYSLWSLPVLWWETRQGLWRSRNWVARPRGIICSSLYQNAYEALTARILVPGLPQRLAMPADLSMTDRLQDVPSRWVRLA